MTGRVVTAGTGGTTSDGRNGTGGAERDERRERDGRRRGASRYGPPAVSEAWKDGWNLAGVWEWVADQFPEAPALSQGERHFTWAEVDRRADGIAATLLAG